MNPFLVYDTETTGLPDFSAPSESPQQPHIVQLAALLVDLDDGKNLASLNVTIRPDTWEIPEDVTRIHGITTEYAREVGIPEAQALSSFLCMWRMARFRVGHNESFDARIIRIAQHRFPAACVVAGAGDLGLDAWKAGKAECTQRLSTPILKLPPTEKMIAAGIKTPHKSANLAEAYKHFTGRELEKAHSAIADAQACKTVYLAIKGAKQS